jgi:hypothetical protein
MIEQSTDKKIMLKTDLGDVHILLNVIEDEVDKMYSMLDKAIEGNILYHETAEE